MTAEHQLGKDVGRTESNEVAGSVDAQIDLNQADGAFLLRAHLTVSVPGVDREQAQALVDAAHTICPYSKAVHGNIEVTTTLA